MIRIIFSEVICKNLVVSAAGGYGVALHSLPLRVWGQNTIQMEENSLQFNTFLSRI